MVALGSQQALHLFIDIAAADMSRDGKHSSMGTAIKESTSSYGTNLFILLKDASLHT